MPGTKIGDVYVTVSIRDMLSPGMRKIAKDVSASAGAMGRGIQKGAQKGILGMVSLQSFVQKIVHYITFSIGVQLVMGVKRGFEALVISLTEFERAITNTATVAGYFGAAFDSAREKVEDLALAISTKTIFSAIDAAKALYSLASAGYNVVEMTERELIPITNYAAATQKDLNFAFQAVTKSIKQFGLDFDDTTDIVDTFTAAITSSYATAEKLADSLRYVGSIAGEVNQSLQTTVAILATLYDRGIEGGQAGQRLNMIFTKLLRPTEHAKQRLAEMGISMRDLNPYTHDMVEILYTLRAANFDAADSANMFRARTAAAATILVSEVDEIVRLRNEMKLAGGLTETLAKKQIATLYGEFEKFQHEIENVGLSLRETLVPILIGVMNIVRGFGGILKALGSTFLIIIGAVIALSLALKFHALAHIKSAAATIAHTAVTKTQTAVFYAAKVAGFLYGMTLIFIHNVQKQGIITTILHTGAMIKNKIAMLSGALATKLYAIALFTKISALAGVTTGTIAATASMGGYTVAVTAATVATSALAVAIAATGIGLLIVGIGLLIANWEGISRAVGGAVDEFMVWVGLSQKQLVLTSQQVGKLGDYRDSLIEINELEREKAEIQEKNREMEEKGIQNTEEYGNNLDRLNQIERELTEVRKNGLEIGQKILNALADTSGYLNNAMVAYQDLIEAQNDYAHSSEQVDELEAEKAKALNNYISAVNETGVTSEETARAQEAYMTIVKRLGDEQYKLLDAETLISDTEKKVKEETEKLNDIEQERYDIATDIIDIQNQMIMQEQTLAELRAKEAIILEALHHWEKLLEEQTRDLWEKQLKLLDATEKLYKLRKEEPGILEEVFEALAAEGMLNEEIIEQYKELMEAQAELMASRITYFDIISSLSPEERALVEEAIATYQRLRDEGYSVAEAFEIAFAGLDIPGLDVGGLAAFAEAEWAMARATESLAGTFEDLLPFLEEAGILTSEQISAWYDYLSISPRIKDAQEDLIEVQEDLSNEYMDSIGVMARVYSALRVEEGGIRSVMGTWTALANELPFVAAATNMVAIETQNEIELLSNLNNLLGTGYTSLSQFSDAELIAAISALAAADAIGMNITPITSVNSLLLEMKGAPTFDDMTASAKLSWLQLGDLDDIMRDINITMGNMDTSIDDLTTAIRELEKAIRSTRKESNKPWYQGIVDFLTKHYEKMKEAQRFRPFAKGGIVGLEKGIISAQRGIPMIKGPTPALIGEAGAEAVVPLEGINKKYGLRILKEIIPSYYPELMKQQGGIIGGGVTTTYGGDTTNVEEYNILGPITVTGVGDVSDFMESLKMRARTTGTRR